MITKYFTNTGYVIFKDVELNLLKTVIITFSITFRPEITFFFG